MIGSGDLEHYYGGLVLTTAKLIAGVDEAAWDRLSARSKNRWLDISIRVLRGLVNNAENDKQMRILSDNHGEYYEGKIQ